MKNTIALTITTIILLTSSVSIAAMPDSGGMCCEGTDGGGMCCEST